MYLSDAIARELSSGFSSSLTGLSTTATRSAALSLRGDAESVKWPQIRLSCKAVEGETEEHTSREASISSKLRSMTAELWWLLYRERNSLNCAADWVVVTVTIRK